MWYSTGTVDVLNGSPNVTLNGGDALANIFIDDGFVGPDGKVYAIQSIASASGFILASDYLGATETDAEYTVVPTGDHTNLRQALAALNTLIGNYQTIAVNQGAGKFDPGTAIAPGLRGIGHEGTGLVWGDDESLSVSVDGEIVFTFGEDGIAVDWDAISDKPVSYPPSAHEHDAGDITSGVLSTARIPELDASIISTGVFDVDRIPVLPSQEQVVSSGGLADLTTEDQDAIVKGVIVTTTDGKRWVYRGTGDKTLEASYTLLADVTPEWAAIAGKPSQFPPSAHEHDAGDITSGTLGLARIPDLSAAKITSGTLDPARIPNLNTSIITAGTFDVARIPNLNASIITAGTLPIARGGTGGTTALEARVSIMPAMAGYALKSVRVNAAGTDFEYVDYPSGGAVAWGDITGKPTDLVSDGDKGDITASGSGTVWTIDAGVVTLAKMANVATGTVFYRKTAGNGAPEVQTLATLKADLGLAGSNSGDQTITLTGDVTGTGTGSFNVTIANASVSLAKMANIASGSLIYRKTAGNGAPETQTLATLKTDLGLTGTNSGDQTITLTGDVTGSGTGSFNVTIGAAAVTYAKIQNVSATDKILGRSSAGAGTIEEITCTSTGRSVLAAANVAAIITLLSAVTLTGVQKLEDKRIKKRVITSGTTSGNQTPTSDTADTYKAVGLTGTIAWQIPSGTPDDEQPLTVFWKDSGSARTMSWVTSAGGYRAAQGVTLPLTTTANKWGRATMRYNSTDGYWDVLAVARQA